MMLDPKLFAQLLITSLHPRNWKLVLAGLAMLGVSFLTVLPLFHGFISLLGGVDMFSPTLEKYPALKTFSHVSAAALTAYLAYFKFGSWYKTRTYSYMALGLVVAGASTLAGALMRWL